MSGVELSSCSPGPMTEESKDKPLKGGFINSKSLLRKYFLQASRVFLRKLTNDAVPISTMLLIESHADWGLVKRDVLTRAIASCCAKT